MNFYQISKYKFMLWIGIISYAAVLRWVYIQLIVPTFQYAGFYYDDSIPAIFHLWGWVLAVMPALWLPVAVKRPSQIICWVLYLLVIAPCTFVPLHLMEADYMQIAGFQTFLIAVFAMLCTVYRLPKLRLPRFRVRHFWTGILLFNLIFYSVMFPLHGFDWREILRLDLDETYTLRDEYRTVSSGAPGYHHYLVEWQGNVVSPLMIAQGIVTGNLFWLGFGLLGELYIFSLAGYKSMLFTAFVLIALLIAIRKQGRYFGLYAVSGMVSLILGSVIFYEITKILYLPSILIRRLIFVPAQITGRYFEFFSSNPKALLGYGSLRWLFDNPYGQYAPARVINYYAFGTYEGNSNGNFWVDAYANFGFFGIFIFTIAAIGILWVFDSAATRRDFRVASLMAGTPSFTMANTALLTGLLSHGIGFTLLLLFLMPAEPTRAKKET